MDSHTRIKICGITRLEDALNAEILGADAIGFVFCAASKRAITPADAATIAEQIPPYMVRVGLFLDAAEQDVLTALEAIPNLVPQFHGTESPESCDAFGRPYVKALGVAEGMPTDSMLQRYKRAQGFLLDSHAPGELGGTGHSFDWAELEKSSPPRLILAGGLYPENVEAAVRQVRPYAVDVSTGVEQAKGVKDRAKMEAFINAVRKADKAPS